MRWSQREERFSNLIFISMDKDLFKMKVELGGDSFYNKVIDYFAKSNWFTNKFL